MTRYLTGLGDVTDVAYWSGISYHLWKEGLRQDFFQGAIPIQLSAWKQRRTLWTVGQLMLGRKPGGYQYSRQCRDRLSKQITPLQMQGEIWTNHQMFPPWHHIQNAGGTVCYYLDATLHSLFHGEGLEVPLDPRYANELIAIEREGYHRARHLVAMAHWTKDVLVQQYSIPPERVSVILPGANIPPRAIQSFPELDGRPGIDRDFVLGFVGKDWKRKGLPFLLEVRDELQRRGWKAQVLAAGNLPDELRGRPGLSFAGFIDKKKQMSEFIQLLQRSDLGCLFSNNEALGISVLEYLHAGVPVSGYVTQGIADTITPTVGVPFPTGASCHQVADGLEVWLRDESLQHRHRAAARLASPAVTWERCVRELQELCTQGLVSRPYSLNSATSP